MVSKLLLLLQWLQCLWVTSNLWVSHPGVRIDERQVPISHVGNYDFLTHHMLQPHLPQRLGSGSAYADQHWLWNCMLNG